MRPDAHKQKASRRYQATHDMAAIPGRGGSGPKRGRGRTTALPTTTAARRAQQQDSTAQGNDAEDNPFAEELESDQWKASAFWTRRRVVDNSFRFEGELAASSDDEDADENVPGQDAGAKAAKLLAERIARTEQRSRTDAGAFKFKDEEAWDQVRESAGGPDADLGAIATLDLNQLDASLASIQLAIRIPAVTAFITSAKPANQATESASKSPSSRSKSRSRSRIRGSTAPVARQQPAASASAAIPPMPAQPPRATSPSKGTIVAKTTTPAALTARPVETKPAEVSKVASMEAWLDDFLDD